MPGEPRRESFFDQHIDTTRDARGRVTAVVFTGYQGPTLKVDYARQQGTYSDGSYCAETFEQGLVEEVHLHEVAGERRGVTIEAWVEDSIKNLYRDVAVFRVDFWLTVIDQQPEREQAMARSAWRSYQRTLEILDQDPEACPALFVVGWAVAALSQGQELPRAWALFAKVWPEVAERLWSYGPVIARLVRPAIGDDRVMACSIGSGRSFDALQAEVAIAALQEVNNETYDAMKQGPIPDRLEETRRGAELEHALIAWWLRAGPELPEGRATSMGDANFIACLRDRGEMVRAADTFLASITNRPLLRARHRDHPAAARALLANGIGACLDSQRPEDLDAILALEQWMADEGLAPDGNAEYGLACTYARLGRRDEALEHLRGAFAQSESPGTFAWARKDQDLKALHRDPRFHALIREFKP